MTQDKQTENMTQDITNKEYDTRQNKQRIGHKTKQTENMTQDITNREYDTRQNKQRI